MRFGLRAKSVDDVNKVKAGLITSRRIIFTPDTDLKNELAKTAVQITCYDRNGQEVKRVTSADEGVVEDNETPLLTPPRGRVLETGTGTITVLATITITSTLVAKAAVTSERAGLGPLFRVYCLRFTVYNAKL